MIFTSKAISSILDKLKSEPSGAAEVLKDMDIDLFDNEGKQKDMLVILKELISKSEKKELR